MADEVADMVVDIEVDKVAELVLDQTHYMVTLPAGVSNGHIEKNCAEENWYYQPCHCLQKLELHKRTKATTITDTPERFSKTRWTFAVLKCVFELKQAGPRWVIVRSDSAAAAAPFTTQSLLAMFAPSKCFLRPKKC